MLALKVSLPPLLWYPMSDPSRNYPGNKKNKFYKKNPVKFIIIKTIKGWIKKRSRGAFSLVCAMCEMDSLPPA
jgi:hypothetical protein